MKKNILFALSIATVLTFCACGTKEASVSTPVVVDEIETSVEEPEDEVVEVEASVEKPEVEESHDVKEEPEVEVVEEPFVPQFVNEISFAQVGVPQTIHLCQYNRDEDDNVVPYSDSIFESTFELLSVTGYENGDNIIYEIMFKYSLENWSWDYTNYTSLMSVFDMETETELDPDDEDCPVNWHYEYGKNEDGDSEDYAVIEVPKDMHLGWYICANIHEDYYEIERVSNMGDDISWALAHFKTAFVDLNPELVNAN